jgi:hypothetical protein
MSIWKRTMNDSFRKLVWMFVDTHAMVSMRFEDGYCAAIILRLLVRLSVSLSQHYKRSALSWTCTREAEMCTRTSTTSHEMFKVTVPVSCEIRRGMLTKNIVALIHCLVSHLAAQQESEAHMRLLKDPIATDPSG